MADANDADRATIARLADEVVPTLIERLASSQLGELEVRQNGWRIRLRRDAAGLADGHATGPGSSVPKPAAGHVAHVPADAHAPRREPPRGVISSPGVGYFTPRDGLQAGASVRRGDVIGAVDVLGVRQEVLSPADGVLKSLEVDAGQAVEYGQPIGRVEAQVEAQVQSNVR